MWVCMGSMALSSSLPLPSLAPFPRFPPFDQLNTKIQEYHNNATSLHLMPKSAKYANGVDYEIRLDSAAGEGGRPMLATDLRGTIRVNLSTHQPCSVMMTSPSHPF